MNLFDRTGQLWMTITPPGWNPSFGCSTWLILQTTLENPRRARHELLVLNESPVLGKRMYRDTVYELRIKDWEGFPQNVRVV